MPDHPYISVAAMAAFLGVSPDVVYRRVDAGTWPACRVGRLIRFSPDQQDEIERLVVEAGTRPAPAAVDPVAEALLKLTA